MLKWEEPVLPRSSTVLNEMSQNQPRKKNKRIREMIIFTHDIMFINYDHRNTEILN